jgi:hypothetical protein
MMTWLPDRQNVCNSQYAKEIFVFFKMAMPDQNPSQHSTQLVIEALLNEII